MNKYFKYVAHVLILTSWIASAKSFRMAAVGDSQSAGTFASSDGIGSKGFDEKHPLVQFLVKHFFNAPKYVYFNGSKINSISERLKIDGYAVTSYNFSQAGANSKDVIVSQLPLLYEEYSKRGFFDAIFIYVGANDLCEFTDAEDYERHQEDILSVTTRLAKRVYVIPLPPVHEIWRAKDYRTKYLLKASTVWSLTGICPQMTSMGELNFTQNSQWRDEWNESLKHYAHGFANTHFVSAMAREPFSLGYVSNVDAFHPNRRAHERYAELIYPYVIK